MPRRPHERGSAQLDDANIGSDVKFCQSSCTTEFQSFVGPVDGFDVRVISGTAGGRKIRAPEGDLTRPITDRAKEGIFNMLVSYLDLEGLTVIDLFAGSGSFGIEALSRGAAKVTFVEQRTQAQQTIRANLETLGLAGRGTIVKGQVQRVLPQLPTVDLAFCDPPYALDEWVTLMPGLPAEVLVGHAAAEIPLVEGWHEVKRRQYGRSHILIAERVQPQPSN